VTLPSTAAWRLYDITRCRNSNIPPWVENL
jgi:hypothetical protein